MRGGNRRGRGRGGRGRGGRGRRGGIGFQPTPPTNNSYPGGAPAPPGAGLPGITLPLGGGGGGHGGGRYSDPNSYKKWNHWNACYSCGFDVPKWYTSATCPWECRKDHHQEGYTRDKYEEYVQAGWRPSKVGKHKKYLPLPGTELGK